MSTKVEKPEDPAPGEDVFTEDDLLPDSGRPVSSREALYEGIATSIAVLAVGMIAGGMIALGAAAAPVVFQLPHPLSGNTMGAAFSRFDNLAMACALIALGAEVARTLVTLRQPSGTGIWRWLPRIRRYLAIVLALATVYVGLQISPQIMAAYDAGVRRNVGAEGAQLEATHKLAELIGKAEVGLAAALVALHILTLSGGRRVMIVDRSH